MIETGKLKELVSLSTSGVWCITRHGRGKRDGKISGVLSSNSKWVIGNIEEPIENEADAEIIQSARDLAEEVIILRERERLLQEACKSMLAWMEFTIPNLQNDCPLCKGKLPIARMNWGGPIHKARVALGIDAASDNH